MTGRRLAQLGKIPVSELESVSPRKAAGLKEMEIETVLDLLTHYPRRIVDRTNQTEIAALSEGEEGVVTATVTRSSARRLKNRFGDSRVHVLQSGLAGEAVRGGPDGHRLREALDVPR